MGHKMRGEKKENQNKGMMGDKMVGNQAAQRFNPTAQRSANGGARMAGEGMTARE